MSIGVPPRRINEIVYGKPGITADTAICLARFFGTSEEFWMNLQSSYELRIERRALQSKVAEITPLYEKCGFLALEEANLWGESTPCLIMVKPLSGKGRS